MLYGFRKNNGGVLIQEEDDEELAIAKLIDSKLISSATDVKLAGMGKVVMVSWLPYWLRVLGEEELLKDGMT